MTVIKLKKSHERWPSDVTHIQQVVINHGFECSRSDAEELWSEYSSSMCAGWMGVPKNDTEVWACICSYIEEDD